MAEGVGFEPTVRLPVRLISSQVPSTTRVCEAMARRGVLTRPIGNVIVVMPPYCTTPTQVERIISALCESIPEVLGGPTYKRKARRLEREKA